MNDVTAYLAEARTAHLRHDWAASYGAFVRVDGLASMTLDDLDAYATAAWRHGRGSEAARLGERVYRGLARTDSTSAALKAAELSLQWRSRGHAALARQWAGQARVLLLSTPVGRVHGYVEYVDAASAIAAGDAFAAAAPARALLDVAVATGDVTLRALAGAVDGFVALLDARVADGQRTLDHVLLPLMDEGVPEEWAGDVYRTALDVGARQADREHVAAWTSSFNGWRRRAGIR